MSILMRPVESEGKDTDMDELPDHVLKYVKDLL